MKNVFIAFVCLMVIFANVLNVFAQEPINHKDYKYKEDKSLSFDNVTQDITVCQSTESDLISHYGQAEVGVQSGYKRLYWYNRLQGSTLYAFVNNKGIVVDYELNPVGTEFTVSDKCSKDKN